MDSIKKKLKIIPALIIFFFFLCMVFFDYAESPVNDTNTYLEIEIPKGSNFSEISKILANAGLVKHNKSFRLLATLKGAPSNIKAGEYDLNSSLTPREIIDKLIKGKIKGYRIPIPEGFTIDQIAFRLAANRLVNENVFINLASDKDLLKSLDIDAKNIEGYLFPDTYIFTRSMGEKKIIETMVRRFREKITLEMLQRAKGLGYSLKEIMTLASIVEKEGGLREEKPYIAAAFHNRLKKGMRLQSDPTVIYGLKEFDGNITRKHLRKKTSYNTYRIKGLPPGPICNPGLDSIQAVLYPASVDYLYFVSKNNGTHHFSTTLESHNNAVVKYQLKRQ